MTITSAKFVKGIVDNDEALEGDIPQVAFIGRSNVGKSSIINTITHKKDLARTSSTPGRTKEINLFLINDTVYLVDLPGYGYAKASWQTLQKIQNRILWYLLTSHYKQKAVVLIIDAKIGLTDNDKEMLYSLEEKNKNIIVVANKVDKIKSAEYDTHMQTIRTVVGGHVIIPFSVKKKTGVQELVDAILK
ncbi:MAG: ribosome biogenesis GTP-binding protein YihA/YsxC [bacterium]|nr:ribosome biogenesis GTP-binding protein YihA/YsxC [bacterium]